MQHQSMYVLVMVGVKHTINIWALYTQTGWVVANTENQYVGITHQRYDLVHLMCHDTGGL